MDPMVVDDGPPNVPVLGLSNPPPPGTMINQTPADVLHELSKFEPFDSTTCSWPDFAERLQEHFDLYNVPSDKRVRILIDRISNATYEKLREICKPVAPVDKPFDELWDIMEKNFNKYSNLFKERVKFNRRYQRTHESVLRYATELRRWSKNCKFPESWWQEALITQFINGIRSEMIRMKLFELKEDEFDKIVEFASNIEATQEEAVTEKVAVNPASAAGPADTKKGSDGTPILNATKDAAERAVKKKRKQNKHPAIESKNQPTNQSKPKNQNKQQVKNQFKNRWTNERKIEARKQNANQFKFQNTNQFKNQFKPQYKKPFLNYSNQLGGQFGDDFRNVLRNQYTDSPREEYSNHNYSNRTVSSTYQPNSSLFYR